MKSKKKAFMMPPPPPLVIPIRKGAKKMPATTVVHVDDSRVRQMHARLVNQMKQAKMLSAMQDIRADIALTEMRQQRFALEKLPKVEKVATIDKDEILHILSEFSQLKKLLHTRTTITQEDGPVIASMNGMKIHKPNCSVVARMPKEQRVAFNSSDEAKSHGYTLCNKCYPESNGTFFGAKEHNKVHRSSCMAIKNINKENLISFETKKEAFDLGFSPCKMCMKDTKTVKVEVNKFKNQFFSAEKSAMEVGLA